jgi:hypothetical protein
MLSNVLAGDILDLRCSAVLNLTKSPFEGLQPFFQVSISFEVSIIIWLFNSNELFFNQVSHINLANNR